jgi:hypothetical protein
MTIFRGFLIVGWLLLFYVTAHAFVALGADGGMVFISDFAHPWRAQFNTDFSLHIVLVALWMFWREPSKAVGLLCALGAMAGGVFTLLYLLIATFRAGGDPRKLLLGRHA